MDEKALLLKFWDKEAPITRTVIARIPEAQSDYRPHPGSRSAREIAWVIVHEQILLAAGLEKGALEWVELPTPGTMSEILATYDTHHDDVTRRLHALDAARYAAEVPFLAGGQEVMRDTGYDTAWTFLFDIIHHRGQLSTYLRPMGAKVPAICGPSADEDM